MAAPTNRAEFREYCLRRLGKPVIEINVEDEQVEDRIDDALQLWKEKHYNGSEKTYYRYQLTQTDIDNKYITIPENIWGAVRIFPIGGSSSVYGMFDVRYQIMLNNIYQFTNESIVPYFMNMQYLELLEHVLVGQQPIRFNRHRNRIHIDTAKEKMTVGQYVIFEAYEVLDPADYTDVWADRWLQAYATALIKRQWGANLSKFVGVQLMSGIQFNGQQIFNDAQAEIMELEENIPTIPVEFMIG